MSAYAHQLDLTRDHFKHRSKFWKIRAL